MTHVHREALLEFSGKALFDLIADIENYPKFMPGCVGAQILRDDLDEVQARLDLQKSGIKQSFATRNCLTPYTRIDMQLIEGPFESLEGFWEITELGASGCKITLDLHFEAGNSIVMRIAGSMFEETANKLVDAVVKRARALYGKRE